MTAEAFLELYGNYMMELRLPLPPDDMLGWIAQSDVSSCELDRIADLLSSMVSKKNENAVTTLKKLSRIPQKSPLTFDNFNMDLLNDKARRQVLSLRNLSFISSKIIKMDELKEKFHDALIRENSGRLLDGLSKYSCLIIDEVGYCKFNREETLLFFQLVDRVSLKETGSIVLTSNKDLSQWVGLFDEDDALECTIDRLWDKPICMTCSGISHRGTNREQVELNFMKLR